jgi:general L-amino acid transport system substrate-binding protein
MKRRASTLLAALLAVGLGSPVAQAQTADGPTLAAVKQRGHVQCGASTGVAGFSRPEAGGEWTGLDVDVCRAIAAATLGDPRRVRFTPLTSQQRLVALQSGEIDVLSRTTTWTMQRDTASGLSFTTPVFYDGQGFLVRTAAGVRSAKELDGATICSTTGTTIEANLADWARTNRIRYTPVTFDNTDASRNAFLAQRCDVLTSDASQLSSIRATQPRPDDFAILPDLISKEPLTPSVRRGDEQWFGIVRWVVFALIEAEELGVTQANAEQMLASPDPAIQRLLGVNGTLGAGMGVDNRWAYNAIRAVGNYGEIFERNVGAKTPLGLPRGLNALWRNGGLMYAMPVR